MSEHVVLHWHDVPAAFKASEMSQVGFAGAFVAVLDVVKATGEASCAATPDGVAASAIRKPVKAVRYSLRRCYEDSRAFESDAHFDLPVVLKWDTDGVKIQIRNPALKNVRACMREVLSEVDWPKLPVGSAVTLPIRLSSH